MARLKVSGDFHSHPKVCAAGCSALGLWTICATWSVGHKLNGRVTAPAAKFFGGRKPVIAKLVSAKLWMPDGADFLMLDRGVLWDIELDRTRPPTPDALRRAVYERDGWRCLHCGTGENLSLDHIVPWSHGGPDTYENFQTLCRPCNSRKGARV